MNENWMGIAVSGTKLIMVGLGYENDGLISIDRDEWQLPSALEKPQAYTHMYERVCNYVTERHIHHIAIGTSTMMPGTTSSNHLKTAELRGVVIIASNRPSTQVHLVDKAAVSRFFGKRKLKDYIADNSFWQETLEGEALPKKYREAAFYILAARQK